MGFAVLFIQGVTEPIKRILGSFNVNVAPKSFLTFGWVIFLQKLRIELRKNRGKTLFISFRAMIVIKSTLDRQNVSLARV